MPSPKLPHNCIFTTKMPIGFVPMGVLLYLSELKQFAHRDIQHPCNAKDHIQRDCTVTVLDAGHMGAAYVNLVRQLNLRQPRRLAVVGVVIPYSADGWPIVVNTDYVLKSAPSVNSDDVVWVSAGDKLYGHYGDGDWVFVADYDFNVYGWIPEPYQEFDWSTVQ